MQEHHALGEIDVPAEQASFKRDNGHAAARLGPGLSETVRSVRIPAVTAAELDLTCLPACRLCRVQTSCLDHASREQMRFRTANRETCEDLVGLRD